MASRATYLSLAFVVALTLACQSKLPTAPSELESGIIVYEHADYVGQSAHITSNVDHLEDFRGPCVKVNTTTPTTTTESWDDCISSIRLGPGASAILYRDGFFDGDQLRVTEDIPNLTNVTGKCDKGGFNDCVTSIRLVPRDR